MALGRVKIEMRGTGKGRWCVRAVAKRASRKHRRTLDRRLVCGGYDGR